MIALEARFHHLASFLWACSNHSAHAHEKGGDVSWRKGKTTQQYQFQPFVNHETKVAVSFDQALAKLVEEGVWN